MCGIFCLSLLNMYCYAFVACPYSIPVWKGQQAPLSNLTITSSHHNIISSSHHLITSPSHHNTPSTSQHLSIYLFLFIFKEKKKNMSMIYC